MEGVELVRLGERLLKLMSDSSVTLQKYIGVDDLFKVVHDLAIDKLVDKDGKFAIRHYFLL